VLVASSARIRDELGWVPRKPTVDEMVADAWAFERSRAGAEPTGAQAPADPDGAAARVQGER
jgi:hypothetical protein